MLLPLHSPFFSCDHGNMDHIDHDSQTWLAELNRRILAGRPVAASELSVLEEAYASVSDGWGPPNAHVARDMSPRTARPAQRPRLFTADRQ